jgi:hypothetical protein
MLFRRVALIPLIRSLLTFRWDDDIAGLFNYLVDAGDLRYQEGETERLVVLRVSTSSKLDWLRVEGDDMGRPCLPLASKAAQAGARGPRWRPKSKPLRKPLARAR